MKKLSRFLLLAFLLLAMAIPTACTIKPEQTEDGFVFRAIGLGSSYAVVDYKGTEQDIVIPATYNGKPVVRIEKGAFSEPTDAQKQVRFDYNEYLTDRQNGDYDRVYYNQIKSVVIPDSITEIGDYAFSACTQLKTVTMTEEIKSIGKAAFTGCRALTDIELSDNANDVNLLPSKVIDLSDGLFNGCHSLTKVTITDEVATIGKLTFAECIALTDIGIKSGEKTFAFVGNEVDTTDSVDCALTEIGNYAFRKASAMKNINFPDSVSYLGTAAFEMDVKTPSQLVGVYMSASITEVRAATFKNCVSLDEEKLDMANVVTIGESIFEGCTSLSEVQLNDAISVIPARAFYGCTGLKEVDLTQFDSVRVIGESAFRNCTQLVRFQFNENTTEIHRYALRGSVSLPSVRIPEGVRVAATGILMESPNTIIYSPNTKNGEKENLPSGWVTKWSDGCASVVYGVKAEDLIVCDVNGNNVAESDAEPVAEYVIINDNEAWLTRYVGQEALVDNGYTILSVVGDNVPVTKVNGSAFRGSTVAIETITVPDSVTEIAEYAFAYLATLKSINIPNQITVIKKFTFAHCTGIETISLPATIAEVEDSAFDNCSSLTSVDLSSVAKIGSNVFNGCVELTSAKLGKVTAISDGLFTGCVKLSNIEVPVADETYKGVTSIGVGAFTNCQALNETVFAIPETVTKIGDAAFENCTGYKTFAIPESLGTIGKRAFKGCTSVTMFTVVGNNAKYIAGEDGILYEVATKAQHNANKPKIIEVDYKYMDGDVEKTGSKNYQPIRNKIIFYPLGNTSLTDLVIDDTEQIETVSFQDLITWLRGYGIEPTSIYCDSRNYASIFKNEDGSEKWLPADHADVVLGELKGTISSIEDYAFEGAQTLKSVTIPANITLGTGVFDNCAALENFTITGATGSYGSVDGDGILYKGRYRNGAFEPTELLKVPANKTVETLTLPATVTKIAVGAFAGCKSIGTLVIGENVASIGNGAFEGAKIGKIMINSTLLQTTETKTNSEGKETTSVVFNIVPADTEALEGEKLFYNANKNFMLDEYGVLYQHNTDEERAVLDKKVLVYVPASLDLSDKVYYLDETNPTKIAIDANAFSGNDTLTTLYFAAGKVNFETTFTNCPNFKTVIYKGTADDYDTDVAVNNDIKAPAAEFLKGVDVKFYSQDMVAGAEDGAYWYYVSAVDADGNPVKYDVTFGPVAEGNDKVFELGTMAGFDDEGKPVLNEFYFALELARDEQGYAYHVEGTSEFALAYDNNGKVIKEIAFHVTEA